MTDEVEEEELIKEVPICQVRLCRHSQQVHTANGCLLCYCTAFKYPDNKVIKKA